MKYIYIYIIVYFVYFLPISAEDITIKWWHKGQEVLTGGTAFSPDGNRVYLSIHHRSANEMTNEIQIWEANTGDFIESIDTELNPGMIDISNDGSKIIIAADKNNGTKVEVVNLGYLSNMPVEKLDAGNMFAVIESICFLPDNDSYAVWIPDNNTIDIYKISDNTSIKRIELLRNSIVSVKFSPNGSFAAVAYENKSVDIWELPTQKHFKSLTLPYVPVDIAFSNNNNEMAVVMEKDHNSNSLRLISIATSKTIKDWQIDKSKTRTMFSGNDDHLILSNNRFGMLDIYKINPGSSDASVIDLDGKYLSAKNNLIAGCNDSGALIIYDISSKSIKKEIKKYDPSDSHNSSRSIMVLPYNKVASGGDKGELLIRDIIGGEILMKTNLHTGTISSMDVDELGLLAVSCGFDDTVKLWNGVTYELIDTYYAGCEYPEAVAISPDGRYWAVAGKSNGILIHNIETGEEYRLDRSQGNIQSLDFSPDSYILLSAGKDKTIRKYQLNEEHKFTLKTFFIADSTDNPYLAGVKAVRFSNDGLYFASSGGDHKTKLWDAKTCEYIKTFIDTTGWKSTINTVTFSHDGKTLYTADAMGIINGWDVETGELMINYEYFVDNDLDLCINSISLSEGGNILTLASEDGCILALELSMASDIENNIDNTVENIHIFPNPAQDEINVEFVTKSQIIVSIFIVDLLGNEILKLSGDEILSNNGHQKVKIDIGALSRGHYFMEIITADDIHYKKLIKY
jgi:WD40 repeat protein